MRCWPRSWPGAALFVVTTLVTYFGLATSIASARRVDASWTCRRNACRGCYPAQVLHIFTGSLALNTESDDFRLREAYLTLRAELDTDGMLSTNTTVLPRAG
jgi:hypothetical protein